MNSNATAGTDNITQTSGVDILTVDALGQVAAGDFFDGGADLDTINLSYTPSGTDSVDFRLATIQNYDALSFFNASLLNSVHFNASQFGIGAGTNNAAMTITGSAGINEIYIHNAASSVVSGFTFVNWTAGTDWVHFLGTSANETFAGSTTADKLEGGAGDDVYMINHLKDTIVELAEEGTDRAEVSVNYDMDDNIENALALGTGNIVITGNDLDNDITGNSGSNGIDGGLGADIMEGGDGNDTYTVDNVGDWVIEGSGVDSGTDTVKSSIDYSIAFTNIENITLLGTDDIDATGNDVANKLNGNSGANLLTGNGGADIIDGNAGADTMLGGAGDDIYYVDNASDVTTETLGNGTDKVLSTVTRTLTAHIENLTLTGFAAINGTGNNSANVIVGNSQVNTLTGSGGNDTLDGGRGADIMIGGANDDYYYVDDVNDIVTESSGQGTDTVRSTVSYTIGNDVEKLILFGNAAVIGTGNTLDNTITGSGANNTLSGGDGNDTIDGGSGSDAMTGGAGNDTFVLDVVGDSVIEASGGGTDTVKVAYDNYVLGTNLENLTLTTFTSVTGTGNAGNNIITGSNGANILYGLAGADTIDGGAGGDTMHGGADNDIYYANHSGDIAVELVGEGTDVVNSSVHYTLGDNVENLVLTGTTGLIGNGNSMNNTITGNSAANTIRGYAGVDTVYGGGGNDKIYGGTGADLLRGEAGTDTFYYDALDASSSASGIDQILDFTTGDRMNVTSIDANTSIGGDQDFVIDTDGIVAAGEIRIVSVGGGVYNVNAYVNSDATIDMQITVTSDHALTASDFIL